MNRIFLFLMSCFMLLAVGVSGPAFADDAALLSAMKNMEKNMQALQQTVERQNQRIAELERSKTQASGGSGETASPMSDYEFGQRLDSATGGAQKWLKDLKFSGDLRLRYEGFHYNSGNPAETDDRNRFRYRLRYGFEKTFNTDMKIGFAMASGETGTTGSNGLNSDPTSTNTTFDNNFNFKPIFIEKAYATYTPGFLAKKSILDKTEVTAGKMNNPFEKGSSDMIWDRDVKPEGIYEKADFKLVDTEDFGLNAYMTTGQFVIDEDATVGGDSNLFAYQMGINPIVYTPFFERPVDLLQSFSFYDYSNYARKSNFLINGNTSASLARGNVNADNLTTELDAGKFKVIESYSELAVYPFNLPTRFSLDLAGNPADSSAKDRELYGNTVIDENFAYGLGVKFGGIVQKGDWELGYQYKHIGANAVVGAFNDSDFGDGHAGKRGSVFKASYALTDNLTVNSALFFVDNLNSGTSGIIDLQQRRFQMDMVWKF